MVTTSLPYDSVIHSQAKRCLCVAVVYFVAGYLGLQAPSFGHDISLIWLPTGIAVAALLRLGYGVALGIYCGAFTVNLIMGSSAVSAGGIALSNTLAPLFTSWLLNYSRFDSRFSHQKDVVRLLVYTAIGMLISATGGVATLWLSGRVTTSVLMDAWYLWWLGDTVGVLIAAPFLLTLTRQNYKQLVERPNEVVFFMLLLLAASWFTFLSPLNIPNLAFLSIPFVLWASLRFGMTGASITTMMLSIMAAWGTATGHGTFAISHRDEALFILWAYISTLTGANLIITALLADSRKMSLEREQALADIRLREEHLRSITETLPILVALIGCDERYKYCNTTYWHVFGKRLDQIVGKTVREFFGDDVYAVLQPNIAKAMSGERAVFEAAFTVFGENRHLEGRYIPQRNSDGEVTGMYVTAWDITQSRRRELNLADKASKDALTGLLNREGILGVLDNKIDEQYKHREALAVFFLDVDKFKQVNDTLGHAMGDQVLITFANRLRSAVRETDFVARLGGDEFVVVLSSIDSPHIAELVAQKVIDVIVQPMDLGGRPYVITTSIGIAYIERQKITSKDLLDEADAALYMAKSAGRNIYRMRNLRARH
jgi:diguanylate cyclase (GGDEF)-like protein/PAS domain S-box-containing protein